MKCKTSGNRTISYQSLLLSTTVLNDNNNSGILQFYLTVIPISSTTELLT